MDAPSNEKAAVESTEEPTSQFREQATAHTVRETTGVKDNECVEPTETAARIRDDDDDDSGGGLCSPSCRDPNAGGKWKYYYLRRNTVRATVTIIYNCRGGDRRLPPTVVVDPIEGVS